MRKRLLVWVVLVFILGWTSSSLASQYSNDSGIVIPQPESTDSTTEDILQKYPGSPVEQASPFDHIKENQIFVYKEQVIIQIEDAEWATFTDTNSMDPVIDQGANAIEIVPQSSTQIHVGDIASYKSNLVDGVVIHRVVEISQDENGWYAIFKGDNLTREDPERVRFDQIQRLVVAIIY